MLLRKAKLYIKHLSEASSITDGFFSKIKIISIYIFLSIKRWIGLTPTLRKHQKLSLHVDGNKVQFFIKSQLDFDVLNDSFYDDQYEIDEDIDAKVIFDLGSNIGTTVVRFYYRYPQAQIFAFEPDPRNIESLKKNIMALPNPSRVTLFEKAVFNTHDSELTFHLGTDHHWSSSLIKRDVTDKRIIIKTVTLDKVMEEYDVKSIDILKYDIEGAEYDVFKDFKRLSDVTYLLGEVHPTLFDVSVNVYLDLFSNFNTLIFNKESGVIKMKNKITHT